VQPSRSRAITVLGAALTAAALPRAAPAQDAAAPVKVGVTTALTTAALYIADRMGFLKDEGLTIEIVPFVSAAAMVAPLGAGQLDVGAGVISAGLYNAVARGIRVRAVADLGSDPPGYGFQWLVIRTDLIKSGRYKTLKDIKGLTLSAPAPGIATMSQYGHMLKGVGLALSDIKVVYMGNPEALVALKSGAIDGSLVPEPTPTIAVKMGVAQKVLSDDAYYPNQQIAVILYGANMLKPDRTNGVKFMRAYLKAVRVYNDALRNGKIAGPQADAILKIFSDTNTQLDPVLLAQVTPNGNNPNGQMNMASLNEDLEFFKQQGWIEGEATPAQLVDTSYIDEALKTLGSYRKR
jgi:NitT/TauT family transport system substrate-binding protein